MFNDDDDEHSVYILIKILIVVVALNYWNENNMHIGTKLYSIRIKSNATTTYISSTLFKCYSFY